MKTACSPTAKALLKLLAVLAASAAAEATCNVQYYTYNSDWLTSYFVYPYNKGDDICLASYEPYQYLNNKEWSTLKCHKGPCKMQFMEVRYYCALRRRTYGSSSNNENNLCCTSH